MTRSDVATLCRLDLELHMGLDLVVFSVEGYRDDNQITVDMDEGEFPICRVTGGVTDHWVYDWCDPYWDVAVRKSCTQLDAKGVSSLWIDGPSRTATPDELAPDSVVSEVAELAPTLRNRLLLWWRKFRRPELREAHQLPWYK